MTLDRPDSAFQAGAPPVFSGRCGRIHDDGPFPDEKLLLWQGLIVLDIPSGLSFIGCCSIYANAHRGKVKKARLGPFPLRIVEDELRRLPSKGWAEMIRKVYEVDPLTCVQCGATMKIIAFLTDYAVVDRIIDHLKLTFIAERPPPSQIAFQELLLAAEASAEYFS